MHSRSHAGNGSAVEDVVSAGGNKSSRSTGKATRKHKTITRTFYLHLACVDDILNEYMDDDHYIYGVRGRRG